MKLRLFLALVLGRITTPFAGTFSEDLLVGAVDQRVAACQNTLTDLHLSKLGNLISLAIAKDSAAKILTPEDRLAIDLANDSQDPVLNIISKDSKDYLIESFQKLGGLEVLVLNLSSGSHFANNAQFQALVRRSDSLVGNLLKARDSKDWNACLKIYDDLPDSLKKLEFIRQNKIFAHLNLASSDDLAAAEKALKTMIETENLKNGENYGLLGSLYKRKYMALADENPEKLNMLNSAIKAYEDGFVSEPTNYYPGINAIVLRIKRGDYSNAEERAILDNLISGVDFSLRHTLMKSPFTDNFWFLATQMQLKIMSRDWRSSENLFKKIVPLDLAPWQLETTLQSLNELRHAWLKSKDMQQLKIPDTDIQSLDEIIEKLKAEILTRSRPKSNPETHSEGSVVVTGLRDDGIILNQRIDLNTECLKTGVCEKLNSLKNHSRGVVDLHSYLESMNTENPTYLLGLTQKHHKTLYTAWADAFNLTTWWKAYMQRGLDGSTPGHIERFMQGISSENSPIVFFIPENIHFSNQQISYTGQEFEWLYAHPEANQNVTYVLGAHKIFSESFLHDLEHRHGRELSIDKLSALLRAYRNRLLIDRGY